MNLNHGNENVEYLIKDCIGDVILTIICLGNICLALYNLHLKLDCDENYNVFSFWNIFLGISVIFPYVIMGRKYINMFRKNNVKIYKDCYKV